MRNVCDLLNFIAMLVIGYMKTIRASTDIYVCETDNVAYLGKYTAGKETLDGAPTYSNSNDLSIFRNKGFWYIGNLAPWPPVTAYRCVEQQGCNYMEDIPPSSTEGSWKQAKKSDQGSVLVVSHEPCTTTNDEL